jgi:hypothetical protein
MGIHIIALRNFTILKLRYTRGHFASTDSLCWLTTIYIVPIGNKLPTDHQERANTSFLPVSPFLSQVVSRKMQNSGILAMKE